MHGGGNQRTLLVQYIPWEFEAIPTRWVNTLNHNMDDVWATSEFVKSHFVRSGLADKKVQLVRCLDDKSRYVSCSWMLHRRMTLAMMTVCRRLCSSRGVFIVCV